MEFHCPAAPAVLTEAAPSPFLDILPGQARSEIRTKGRKLPHSPPPRCWSWPSQEDAGGLFPAPGEGGATAQVGQVGSLDAGVFRAARGSDCSPACRGRRKQTAGPRIQLWGAEFVLQTLPWKKTMEEKGVRNFKELRAKFQKLDTPPLPGPIKFPAGISQKGDTGSTQSTQIPAKGKPLSSSHKQPPPCCSRGESQLLTAQKTQLAQSSGIQICSNSPGSLGTSVLCSAVNSQKASLLLDASQSNAEITNKEKVVVPNSFREKLWNWEKVSSQKSEMSSTLLLANCESEALRVERQKGLGLITEESRKKMETKGAQTLPSQRHLMVQRKSLAAAEDPSSLLSQHGRKSQKKSSPERSPAGSMCQPIYECELASQAPEKQPDVRHHHLPKMKPLPSIQSLGPPPPKPAKPPVVSLQVFRRQPAAVPKTQREVAVEECHLPPESAEFEEPHNYEATISYLRHSGNSINLCTAEEIADSTYEVGIEELQKPWRSFFHQELSPKHEDKDKKMKDKEPCEMEPLKTEKDPHSNRRFKSDAYEGTPGKIQMTNVHRGERTMLAGKQDAATDITRTKVSPEGPKLARHSQGHDGYVEALQATKETPHPEAFKSSTISEETYDDVEYPRRETPKSDFSNSFASDSERNSEEMYDDVYKTRSNYSKIDLDGKEALKRLQKFFKKERNRFKTKKTKSKENVSASSISLPDLEPGPQGVTIYDDVDLSEKESKDEDKLKTWKPKFLIPKGKRERKKDVEESGSSSSRNFFRTKKQNLEKNRMEREEKLFRERFKYDKEITVINTAVVCSNSSRNGIFDLPIIPGEELEVIDTTEQNLVICRNSKGKYGYVLIENLHFKPQSWSP
ncbi:FYN-binding protein 2 isoform X2 [Microcebus murinus]|uniref:FYN-binding protein 2 isoform X2 n=1 Tax=Microcebus murinus TaxID=30608 RepID=UPI003F6AB7A9